MRKILSQPDPADALVLFTRAGVPVAELALHCGPVEEGHRELVVVFGLQRHQTLALELVRCGFHPRWLARCGCGRRARKLYLTEGPKVCCWRCAGLQYASAQEHDARLDALKRDLPALVVAAFNPKRPMLSHRAFWLLPEILERARRDLRSRSPRRRYRAARRLAPEAVAELEGEVVGGE